jgi:hypothetical protein
MAVQTVEISGRRFVLLPEDEFRELERKASQATSQTTRARSPRPRFADVTPFVIRGESASDMLIRERR